MLILCRFPIRHHFGLPALRAAGVPHVGSCSCGVVRLGAARGRAQSRPGLPQTDAMRRPAHAATVLLK